MAAPLADPTATIVYRWVGPAITRPDEEHDWALAHLVNAVTAALAEVEAVTRASDGRVGWAIALDPDTAPAELLGWLAPFAGVALDDRLSTAGQRQQIKDRPYHRRGTVEAIKAAARPWLAYGDVVLVERDGSAYRLTIQYAADQVDVPTLEDVENTYPTLGDIEEQVRYLGDLEGDLARMQDAVEAAKPRGLVLNFQEV
jgi:hypothetical protein